MEEVLTEVLLPDEDESGETKEEQHSPQDGLPLVCPFVHLCVGLVEFHPIHWGKKKHQILSFNFPWDLQVTRNSAEGGERSLRLPKKGMDVTLGLAHIKADQLFHPHINFSPHFTDYPKVGQKLQYRPERRKNGSFPSSPPIPSVVTDPKAS